MKRPQNGRALFYTRDSGGKHETTPGPYVNWAAAEARSRGLSFDGSPDTIETLIQTGQPHSGDVFIDYGVCGNVLSRAGLNALRRSDKGLASFARLDPSSGSSGASRRSVRCNCD